ncbi:cytochrome C peroxidase [Segetibacter sp. 3557_3]|nr:cytochrome C peroxidase [Segetibacter sp. 3557_3]
MDVELIRIYTLGITGFDAPRLKSGIEESYAAMTGVAAVLQPYLGLAAGGDSVKYYLAGSLQYLTNHNDFDRFNRLAFLTDYALPLQRSLRLLIRDLKLQLSTADSIVNNLSANLFSTDAIHISAFGGKQEASKDMIGLGRKLFFETLLSGNNKISCATCHNPAKHFADGLPTSLAFNGHSNLKRNAPTLLYSAYQYEQFWEGRAKTLDEQIRSVLLNPDEMNGDETKMITSLEQDKDYKVLFNRAFPKAVKGQITTGEVATAIAAFVQTLNPRNSAFDKYLQGDRTAMSDAQINGFNLFMGKAQCGTCHFAPLFNGLMPPAYNKTEIEVIGTPRTANFDKPQPDTDSGRYNTVPISFYQGAFKTPTIRNAAVTGPYMHNGSFSSLEQVLDFYNKGGGKGIGLNIGNQTLSPLPLNLTSQEMENIIQFIESLTDTIELPIE